MYVYINGVDKSQPIRFDSVSISKELQQRARQMSFQLFDGPLPGDYAEVRAFRGFPVTAFTSNSVTLNAPWNLQCQGMYRVGDWFYVNLNTADEHRRIISAVENVNGFIKVTVSQNWLVNPTVASRAGKIEFAGNVIDRSDENEDILQNALFNVACVGYSRIFDKQNLNDSFLNRDSRYIINDFCNSTINRNVELDGFLYTNSAELQAVWIESGDASNPTLDTLNFREGDGAGSFGWTFSGGTATWTAAIQPKNISDYAGVSSGAPTKGRVGLWLKASLGTAVTAVNVRVGSDSSNYVQVSITPDGTTDWAFYDTRLASGTVVGTPDWTALDYVRISLTENASASIKIDGLRIFEDKFFRHYPYVQETDTLATFNMNRIKPTEVLQRLADTFLWFWYIDEERYIHFFPQETQYSPFNIDEESDNFRDLRLTYDSSRLINRQVIEGGFETSSAIYTEVRQGDGIAREWITKGNFKNLSVLVADITVDLTATTGTTTTTVVTTVSHGLLVGDYIVNRTAGNEVRKILTVPAPNQFTVEAIAGQVSGNTYSKFFAKNVGTEGYGEEGLFDYMSNFTQKSIRNASSEATLEAGQFIEFSYNEVNKVIIQRSDPTSIAAVKAMLGHTNGIIDGQVIKDSSITSSFQAAQYADGILAKFSNTIITATFETDYDGLEPGMVFHIKDTLSSDRSIDRDFVIQSVVANRIDRWSTFRYKITCSSLLFGMLELFLQLLQKDRERDETSDETITNLLDFTETVELADSHTLDVVTAPFKYGPDPNVGRYNLSSYV